MYLIYLFGFNVTFNLLLRAEETSTYELVKILYCNVQDIGKQLLSFPGSGVIFTKAPLF